MPAISYVIEFTLVIDRPMLRMAGMTQPKAGTRLFQKWHCKTQREAVRVMEEMCRGAWDYVSEYVASVRVIAKQEGKSARIVRKLVERTVDRSDYACGVDKITYLAVFVSERPARSPKLANFNNRLVRMSTWWTTI